DDLPISWCQRPLAKKTPNDPRRLSSAKDVSATHCARLRRWDRSTLAARPDRRWSGPARATPPDRDRPGLSPSRAPPRGDCVLARCNRRETQPAPEATSRLALWCDTGWPPRCRGRRRRNPAGPLRPPLGRGAGRTPGVRYQTKLYQTPQPLSTGAPCRTLWL